MAWVFLAALVLAGLFLIGARTVKRRQLGKVLWAAPAPDQRWLAFLWLVVAAMRFADAMTGAGARHQDLAIISMACFLLCAVICYFPPSAFFVHEGGLCVGLLCFSWREISGWSWGPGAASTDLTSLNIAGIDKRGLCLWSTSKWRWFYEPRSGKPIRTRIVRNAELEALLHQYAPSGEVSSVNAW